jgi:hypothetical protein
MLGLEFNPVLIAGLFFFAIAVRWLPVKDADTGFDTYFYLLSARAVHRQKIGISGSLALPLIPPQSLAVPYLCQWVFGLLPPEFLTRHHSKIGVVADSAFAVLIYYLTSKAGYESGIALKVFLLYLFTPAMFSRVAIGPRVHNFTPRLFSEITGNLFYIVIFLSLPIEASWRIAIAAVLAAIIILTSKFGLQVMLFMVPLAVAFSGDVSGLFALVLGFVLAFAATQGRFLGSMNEQLKHLTRYAIRNFRKEMPISNRNSLGKLKEYLGAEKAINSRLAKVLYYFLSVNSYTGVLLKFSTVPIVLMFLTRDAFGPHTANGIGGLMAAPIYASAVCFFLVNLPPLLFLGEAERYLNHVAYFFFLTLALCTQPVGLSWIVLATLLCGVTYWFCEITVLPRLEKGLKEKEKASREVLEYFRVYAHLRRIALYPYHAIGVWRVAYETNHDVVYPISLGGEELKAFQPYSGTYPFIDLTKIDQMFDAYGVNTLVVLNAAPLPNGLKLPELWHLLPVGSKVFSVYERSATEANSSQNGNLASTLLSD